MLLVASLSSACKKGRDSHLGARFMVSVSIGVLPFVFKQHSYDYFNASYLRFSPRALIISLQTLRFSCTDISFSLIKGLRSELALVVSKYQSKAACVHISRKIASPYACEQVLQEIPASLQMIQFIDKKDRPSRTGYSKLPKYHENGKIKPTNRATTIAKDLMI